MQIQPTWDDTRMMRDRLVKLQAEMRRRNIGALYLRDPMFLRYVLNTRVPGGAVFVPVDGEPIAIVRRRDLGYVAEQGYETRLTWESREDEEATGDTAESNNASALGPGL